MKSWFSNDLTPLLFLILTVGFISLGILFLLCSCTGKVITSHEFSLLPQNYREVEQDVNSLRHTHVIVIPEGEICF